MTHSRQPIRILLCRAAARPAEISNLDIVRNSDLDLVICLNPTSSLHPIRAIDPREARQQDRGGQADRGDERRAGGQLRLVGDDADEGEQRQQDAADDDGAQPGP